MAMATPQPQPPSPSITSPSTRTTNRTLHAYNLLLQTSQNLGFQKTWSSILSSVAFQSYARTCLPSSQPSTSPSATTSVAGSVTRPHIPSTAHFTWGDLNLSIDLLDTEPTWRYMILRLAKDSKVLRTARALRWFDKKGEVWEIKKVRKLFRWFGDDWCGICDGAFFPEAVEEENRKDEMEWEKLEDKVGGPMTGPMTDEEVEREIEEDDRREAEEVKKDEEDEKRKAELGAEDSSEEEEEEGKEWNPPLYINKCGCRIHRNCLLESLFHDEKCPNCEMELYEKLELDEGGLVILGSDEMVEMTVSVFGFMARVKCLEWVKGRGLEEDGVLEGNDGAGSGLVPSLFHGHGVGNVVYERIVSVTSSGE